MVNASGLEPVGQLILYAFAPLHLIVLVWFVMRRHVFPISGRQPQLSISLMILAVPCTGYIGYQLLVPSDETPCYISWYLFGPITCAFIPIQTIRATLLLCQFEITKDLNLAESVRNAARQRYQQQQHGGNVAATAGVVVTVASPAAPIVRHTPSHMDALPIGSPSLPIRSSSPQPSSHGDHPRRSRSSPTTAAPTWTPSFWTRNRVWFRGNYWRRLMCAWVLVFVIVCGSTSYLITSPTASCSNPNHPTHWRVRTIMLWFCVASMVPFSLWLLIVVYHLRRHPHDGYGLVQEFKWLASGSVLIPIAIACSRFLDGLPSQTSFIMGSVMIGYLVCWIAMGVWPLILSYRHQAVLKSRLSAITNVTKLSDLLAIPEGYESFLAFSQTEFNSEGVLFWKRIVDFRSGSIILTSPPPVVSSMTPAGIAAATTGIAVPPVTKHATNKPQVPDGGTGEFLPSLASDQLISQSLPSTSHQPSVNQFYSQAGPLRPHQTAATIAAATAPIATSGTITPTSISAPLTVELAQQLLLNTLIEANGIYSYYIDSGAPNELALSMAIRMQVRRALDGLIIRAAPPIRTRPSIHIASQGQQSQPQQPVRSSVPATLPVLQVNNNGPDSFGYSSVDDVVSAIQVPKYPVPLISPTSAARVHASTASNGSSHARPSSIAPPPAATTTTTAAAVAAATTGATQPPSTTVRVHTKKGVSVSTMLPFAEVYAIEMELRSTFNQVQDVIVNMLHIQSFQRFRASGQLARIIMDLKGFTVDGKTSSHDVLANLPASGRRGTGTGIGTGGNAPGTPGPNTPKKSARAMRGGGGGATVAPAPLPALVLAPVAKHVRSDVDSLLSAGYVSEATVHPPTAIYSGIDDRDSAASPPLANNGGGSAIGSIEPGVADGEAFDTVPRLTSSTMARRPSSMMSPLGLRTGSSVAAGAITTSHGNTSASAGVFMPPLSTVSNESKLQHHLHGNNGRPVTASPPPFSQRYSSLGHPNLSLPLSADGSLDVTRALPPAAFSVAGALIASLRSRGPSPALLAGPTTPSALVSPISPSPLPSAAAVTTTMMVMTPPIPRVPSKASSLSSLIKPLPVSLTTATTVPVPLPLSMMPSSSVAHVAVHHPPLPPVTTAAAALVSPQPPQPPPPIIPILPLPSLQPMMPLLSAAEVAAEPVITTVVEYGVTTTHADDPLSLLGGQGHGSSLSPPPDVIMTFPSMIAVPEISLSRPPRLPGVPQSHTGHDDSLLEASQFISSSAS